MMTTPARGTFSAIQLSASSRLFSSRVIRELSKAARSSSFARLASQAGLTESVAPSTPVSGVFDFALNLLQRNYRDEYVFKDAVIRKIVLGQHRLHTASLLHEFRIGRCKADVVVLNGTSTVYEIKSDRDNLDRLSSQVDEYLSAFASVYVVTSQKQFAAVRKLVPEEVGLYVLSPRHTLSKKRLARISPDRIDPGVVFSCLQRQEAIEILSSMGVAIPDVPNTRVHSELKDLFAQQQPRLIHDEMIRVLRKSRSQVRLADSIRQLPQSLKAAALCANLDKKSANRLIQAIQTPFKESLQWA